ncbi:conserved hypothetical protein [Ricinus communis]|uniref:Uncharacterized protein n=1 Tax=Ricinus communis TaxID=3988 RepID=B9T5K3_RICCO|nr:conserved hypothetical protein [Ricinus communis]
MYYSYVRGIVKCVEESFDIDIVPYPNLMSYVKDLGINIEETSQSSIHDNASRFGLHYKHHRPSKLPVKKGQKGENGKAKVSSSLYDESGKGKAKASSDDEDEELIKARRMVREYELREAADRKNFSYRETEIDEENLSEMKNVGIQH